MCFNYCVLCFVGSVFVLFFVLSCFGLFFFVFGVVSCFSGLGLNKFGCFL